MIHRYRQLSTVVLVAVCMFAVAACGSSSSSTSTSGGPGARPAGFQITTSQRSCLQKHGVTLPAGGFAGRGGRGGHFTGSGKPPRGAKFPAHGKPGAHGGFAANPARSKALKACGVTFGSGARGRPGAAATTAG